MKLLQEGDVLIEQATGIEYTVYWVDIDTNMVAGRFLKPQFATIYQYFHRDTTHGIRTYLKSDRIFTLKPTDTI